jgi:hypothetical protein
LELLIATGVLVWAPFIWATPAGKHVSIPPYLAVHLPCILTGVWLKWRGAGTPPKSGLFRTQKLGNLMIWIGIGAWVPYFLIKSALEPGPLPDHPPEQHFRWYISAVERWNVRVEIMCGVAGYRCIDTSLLSGSVT